MARRSIGRQPWTARMIFVLSETALTRFAPQTTLSHFMGEGVARTDPQPLPSNGILVALMVMNRTFVSSGNVAMVTTARPT